jgi:menaquinone-dependent protoporphyrinogen oxidase
MARFLVVYSTVDGHTLKICERLRGVLERAGHRVDVVDVADDPSARLREYDRIVVGASIRYGKHHPRVVDFVERNAESLQAVPNAFFSVNVVARKPEKRRPETNPYLQKFLKRIRWRPALLEVFAGRLDYPSYGAFDRAMIRFIMWMTKGPTDPATVVEFTDWGQVDAFGERLAAL